MRRLFTSFALTLALVGGAAAQEMPADYTAVLKTLGKTGDFRDNVLRVNLPRTDLTIAVDGVLVPTPLGFGGWLAFTKGSGGRDVMMGDLVLTESEVNPVMSAVLSAGLEVTALHNHFSRDTPRVYYMHVHGHGSAADLATRIRPAVDLIARDPFAVIAGSDADAVVAGDVAMLAAEVTPVLKALREHGLQVVALHHHMTGSPTVYFVHYWGKGPAARLAQGVHAAVDLLARK